MFYKEFVFDPKKISNNKWFQILVLSIAGLIICNAIRLAIINILSPQIDFIGKLEYTGIIVVTLSLVAYIILKWLHIKKKN